EGLRDVRTLSVADFSDIEAALAAYLAACPGAGREVASAAIAAAGPRDGDVIDLTNAPWRIAAGAISRALGGAPVRVMNDLEAVALGLPGLGPEDAEPIAGARRSGAALPMLAANIGTGFGAAIAVPC